MSAQCFLVENRPGLWHVCVEENYGDRTFKWKIGRVRLNGSRDFYAIHDLAGMAGPCSSADEALAALVEMHNAYVKQADRSPLLVRALFPELRVSVSPRVASA